MKNYLIAAAALAFLALTGCAGADAWVADNADAINKATEIGQVVADVANPATGGLSGLIFSLSIGVLTTIYTANRAIVAHKRKTAIKEMDSFKGSVPALDQVATPSSVKTVKAALA